MSEQTGASDRAAVAGGKLLTAAQVNRLPDGEYEIEEFIYKRVVGRKALTETRFKVWRAASERDRGER